MTAGLRGGQIAVIDARSLKQAELAKLLQDAAIDVDTTDRVVTLRGTVASNAAKARAAEIAGRTEGVTHVINQLVVKGT